MNKFNSKYEVKDNKLIISLHGDLDAYYCQKFKDEFIELINKYVDTINIFALNLKDLNYIDSSGLGTLVSVLRIIKEKEKKLGVYNLSKNIKRIFTITRLEYIFDIYDNLIDIK